jgi:ABC-type amino acid transport substrate-binding protein
LILICFTSWPALAADDQAGPVFRFFYDVNSPLISEDASGRVQGLLSPPVASLMAAVPFTIKLTGDSWARAWASVQTEKNTCLVPLARTPDRITQFSWIGPIYKAYYVVIALKKRRLKLDSLESAVKQKLTVGVVASQASDDIAKAVPGLHREPVTAPTLNFRKLLAGRVDIIIKREGIGAESAPDGSRDLIEKILDLPPIDVGIGCNLGSDPSSIQMLKSQADRLFPSF